MKLGISHPFPALKDAVAVVEEELELGVSKVGEAEGRLEAEAALQPGVGVAEHPFHLRLVPEQQHRDVLSGLVVHLLTARGVKRRCSQLPSEWRVDDLCAEYADMRAGRRYCAAYSEHGVSATERKTVSTTEYARIQRSACPLER